MLKNNKVFDVYVYHDKCMDGLTAVAIALQARGEDDGEYLAIAGSYGKEIDLKKFKDKRVCFLDFSVGKARMLQILDVAKQVTVIDHHISVYKELTEIELDGFKYVYDVNKSGAQLAWDYFIGTEESYFVALIGDRDIWTKRFADADVLNLALRVENHSLEQMCEFIKNMLEFHDTRDVGINSVYPGTRELIDKGYTYKKYHDMIIEQIASHAYFALLDDGTPTMKVNCPQGFVSEVGQYLYNRHEKVAWMYTVGKDQTYHSLRVSDNSDYDASVYAKSKGGGGHKKACGWSTDNN